MKRKFKIGNLVRGAWGSQLVPGVGLMLTVSASHRNWVHVYWFKHKEIHEEHINWIEKV